jgi:hypothetical protein
LAEFPLFATKIPDYPGFLFISGNPIETVGEYKGYPAAGRM